jgi:CheY-like chemotaxis protein
MRVLLVEDDASLAVLFRMFLNRMGKGALEITHAFTGEEALQRVNENSAKCPFCQVGDWGSSGNRSG